MIQLVLSTLLAVQPWCPEMYRWRKDDNRIIHVTVYVDPSGPPVGEKVPVLSEVMHESLRAVRARWEKTVRPIAAKYGVPWEYPIVMIRRESGGDPSARSADGGLGLMQITSPELKEGLTDEELLNPIVNVNVGTHYLSRLMNHYGDDFPVLSAAYNAGGRRPTTLNEWGMVCTGSHIDDEVCALNSLLLDELAEQDEAAHAAFEMQFNLDDTIDVSREPREEDA